LLAGLRPEIQKDLESRYTLHSMASLQEGWLDQHAAEIDGVVTGGHNGIPAGLMAKLPNLKIVGINGVGYDRVDLEMAKQRGIRVTNTPDVLTDDVADLAIGLTLTLLRRIHHAHSHVTAGKWTSAEMPLARKMSGRQFGILGMGRIGQAVAKRLGGFDAKISYTDIAAKQVPYTFVPDLLSLARGSEVLIVCAAASGSTAKLVNREVLEAIGPDGFLVNIARGSIVDEDALVAVLKEGKLGGAGLDVFADEPNVPAGLMDMENVVLTPHIASATHETRGAMGRLMVANIDAFFAGKDLLTPVV
jgi:lactate dehydrogenase-like 2-hydroxyacid dehydrogenase